MNADKQKGGLITLIMFLKGWLAVECIITFKGLADVAFYNRLFKNIPFLSFPIRILLTFLNNVIYLARYLEQILRETYNRSI